MNYGVLTELEKLRKKKNGKEVSISGKVLTPVIEDTGYGVYDELLKLQAKARESREFSQDLRNRANELAKERATAQSGGLSAIEMEDIAPVSPYFTPVTSNVDSSGMDRLIANISAPVKSTVQTGGMPVTDARKNEDWTSVIIGGKQVSTVPTPEEKPLTAREKALYGGLYVGSTVASGVGNATSAVGSTLDATIGQLLKAFGWENNPVSNFSKELNREYEGFRASRDEAIDKLGWGKGAEVVGDLIEGTVAALPQALAALATGGSSLSSTASSLADDAVMATGNLLQKIGVTTSNVMKNPQFWMSYAQSYGNDYYDAIDSGASEEAAVLTATAKSLINSGVEIGIDGGSGMQGLVDDIAKGGKKLLRWVESSIEEGMEEVVQGFISRLVDKFALGKDVKVLDPWTSAQEFGMGTAVGAILGGGQTLAVNAVSDAETKAKENYLNDTEQKVFDKEVENRIKKAEESGEKVTKSDIKKIEKAVKAEMEKGYLSTDLIEEVLGGETYKSYQNTTNEIKQIEDQLAELEKEPNTVGNSKKFDSLQAKLEELRNNFQKDHVKNKLSEEVKGLVQGSRLMESYNEAGRRKQAFEADLSQYDSKQQEVIKKAVESGILNNTNRTHEFVDFIAKISADKGVLFDFTNNAKLKESGFAVDGKFVNGYVTKDGVTVNIQSAKALNSVVGHEVTHVLEGTEFYNELQSAVTEYAKAKGEYQSRYDAIAKLYKNIEGANIDAELTADLVGDYLFTDSDFINNLSTEHRNVFQKIFDEVKYLLKTATAGSKEAQQLEKVKRAFENAYRATKNTADSGVKYSLNAFEQDGRRYVEIDQDQSRFDGHSIEEFPRIAKEIINEKFNGRVVGIDNKMFVNGAGRDEFSNPSKRLPNDLYEAKMRTSGELDNLLDAGTNFRNAPDGADGHHHKDVIGGFDYFDTLFKIGDRYFEAVINIKNVAKGKLFKDVTKIKDVTQDIMSSYGENPKSQFLRTSSMDIVSELEGNVNRQFSLSDSTGRQLTQEQTEYFKDSKIRDENGNLMVLYHGTPNGDYTVFKDGTYFTDNKEYADRYQNPGASSISSGKTASNPKTFEVYLNITKPFDLSDPEARRVYIEDYIKGGNAMGINPYLSDAEYDKIETIDWTEGEDLREFLIDNGYDYDGLVLDEGADGGYGEEVKSRGKSYVVFSPEQVKNVDNQSPTSDPDIRRSLSAEEEAPTKYGDYNVYGEDVALGTDEIAPVAENAALVAENDTIANEIAPEPVVNAQMEDIAPVKETQKPATKAAATANVLTEEPDTEKTKSGVMGWVRNNLLDKGMVFEKLSKKTKNKELEAKWNSIRYSQSKAQNLIGNGNGKVKSLNSIKEAVDKTGKTKQFYEYLYHRHNVDRMTLADKYQGAKNKPVFGEAVTADISRAEVRRLELQNPKFKQFAKDVYDYMTFLRDEMVANGIISKDLAKQWAEMYPNYVPIRRSGDNGVSIDVPLDTRRTGVNAPIKRATGGSADIMPLFDTMGQRTLQTYKAIAKNRFGVELMNTLGTSIAQEMSNVDDVIANVDADENLLQEGKNGKNPTFTVFDNGEKVTFEITEEMYDALKPSSKIANYTNKVTSTMSSIFRGLTTEYNPTFMITNPIKDLQDVLINSQHPVKTYAAIPRAISEIAKGGKLYQEYIANGGEQNTYFDNKSNKFVEEKKIPGLYQISQANGVIEMIPRLSEYIASREAGRSIDVSMLDAARVTTNFAAGGDVTKFLNRNGATFLNASVQGAIQQARNIQEAKMNGLKGWAGLAAKFIAAGLPAILLNNFIWDDDEEYDELSEYVKQNYYVVGKFNDGQFVRIPKGRTVAVIQDAFKQISNYITGDDEVDLKSFLDLAVSNLAPNNPLDNNIIAPLSQAFRNKTWYGDDLVPTRLQDLPAAEQYDESTDMISRWLGEKVNTFLDNNVNPWMEENLDTRINISPYKINYVIDQSSGGLGDTVLPMLTPEAESGDNTFVGNLIAPLKDKFTTDSVMNNQNVSDFYDLKKKLETNAKSAAAEDEDILMSMYIDSVNSELNELYKKKREYQNSSLPDSAKYELVRNTQKQIVELAKSAMETYSDVKIDGDIAIIGDTYYEWYKPENDDPRWRKMTDAQKTKYLVTSAAGDAYYATNGSVHYYKNEEGEWTKISDNQLERQNEVTKALGITPEEYWEQTEISFMPMSNGEYEYAYDNPTNYALAKAVGGYDAYQEYSEVLSGIKNDTDENGEKISNTRKHKVYQYIYGLDIPEIEKHILFKSQYTSDDSHNIEIIEYLVSREDISYDETVAILKKLEFEVSEDGTVRW